MRLNTRIPAFKPAKDVHITWDSFRKGINLLLKENEIDDSELAQADNLLLVGKGIPTKRWGTLNYFLSSATGTTRGLEGFYQKDGTNQLLAITDQGVLTQKSGATYSIITGASWASGQNVYMAQLDNQMYIVNGQREVVRYSNPTLSSFPTIATPTGLFATGLSGVSGTNSLSYRVSAINDVGETVASSEYELPNQPEDPSYGTVKLNWTAVSTASGVLKGYNIYGRKLADERYLGSVVGTGTEFIDNGSSIVSEFGYPPTADSTGGINAKFVARFEDRLIYAGVVGEPSKVVISGRVPSQDKLDISYGGNYVLIEPDAGDDITGLGVFEDRIIVFKERSVWQITLSYSSVGNFSVTQPNIKLITASHGCIAPRSIMAVENDVFFLTRKGVYALGYEPNVFNVLRTNEISAKIRPFFDGVGIAQKKNGTAFYHNSMYGITFPGKGKTVVYDRERLAWMGPWTRDANLSHVYYDSAGNDHLLYGADDTPYVVEYSKNYGDDNGSAIPTSLRTKKGDFGDWARFKNIKEVFALFRNVQGTVNFGLRLQQRDGQVTTAKSFNIENTASDAGWGADGWGEAKWGDTSEDGGAVDISEIYRHSRLNKVSRNLQAIITTNNRNDNYEFLSLRSRAKPLSTGFLPASERV